MADSITAAVAGSAVGWAPPVPTRSLDIDPFDRMLLTADGTVTTLLEACTGEPIVTRTTRQAARPRSTGCWPPAGRWWHPDAQLLELAPAERLIARRVTLRGARSGVAYVLAESLVVPDRLPGAIADRLLRAGASLGRLLAARQLETRRDDPRHRRGASGRSRRPPRRPPERNAGPPHLHDRDRPTVRRRGDRMARPRTPRSDRTGERRRLSYVTTVVAGPLR